MSYLLGACTFLSACVEVRGQFPEVRPGDRTHTDSVGDVTLPAEPSLHPPFRFYSTIPYMPNDLYNA